jgi:hypothetical protein
VLNKGSAPAFVQRIIKGNLKNASSGESLDGANANHVTQACGGQHAGVTHASKERGAGQFDAFVLMLNRGFANPDGDDIADHHHKGNLG